MMDATSLRCTFRINCNYEKLLIVDKSAAYKSDNEGKTPLNVAAGLGRVGRCYARAYF